MTKVLAVMASPKPEHLSLSTRICQSFLDQYQSQNPQDTVWQLALHKTNLPLINQDTIDFFEAQTPAKTGEQSAIDALCQQFITVDKYIFAFPNWNLLCPADLVTYLLCVVRAGKAFSYTPQGVVGLLQNKKALLIISSGGYCTDHPYAIPCFGIDWLQRLLALCGITDISLMIAQGGEQLPDQAEQIEEKSLGEAHDLATVW